MYLVDLNGDGKADVCARTKDGVYCALSNGGTGFAGIKPWTTVFTNSGGWNVSAAYWGTLRFPDLNGDGKADICGRGGDAIYCGLSDGTTFGAVTPSAPEFSDAKGFVDIAYAATIQYPDINGDGKADVCGRVSNGVLCGLSLGNGKFGPVTNWQSQFSDAVWKPAANSLTVMFPVSTPGNCRTPVRSTPFNRMTIRVPF